MSETNSNQYGNGHPGHETTDAKAKPVALFLVGLAASVFVAMLLMAWLLNLFQLQADRTEEVPTGLTDQEQIPPAPRLQAYPAADLERLRRWEEEQLNSYEWIDEKTGIMRIPIDRAMEIIVEKGLPARPQSYEKGEEERALLD